MLAGLIQSTEIKKILQSCVAVTATFCILRTPKVWNFHEGQEHQVDEIHRLWREVVDPNLQAKIQTTNQAETLGATMMVPLHAAFQHQDEAWMRSFTNQFAGFASNPSALPSGESAEISRLYYLYLASQFIVLAKQSGHQDLIPANLPGLLFSEVQTYWSVTPAWQWNRKPFPGAARERLLWKLQNRNIERGYYRAVLDHDLYIFAMAADLQAYAEHTEEQQAWKMLLGDVLTIARRVFSQEVVYQPGGGWLFQPGVWTNHPEYQYAGNHEVHPGIKPSPVQGIGTDSSHSLRFPLWLTSLMHAYAPGSQEYRFYENLRSGLEKQFFNKVLIAPTAEAPCFLLMNFMDGTNGVYRWGYQSLGKDNGYGPYQLSGSFLLGWWVFLDTDRIREVYRQAAAQFPWPRQCFDFYLAPRSASNQPTESAYSAEQAQVRMYHVTVQLAANL